MATLAGRLGLFSNARAAVEAAALAKQKLGLSEVDLLKYMTRMRKIRSGPCKGATEEVIVPIVLYLLDDIHAREDIWLRKCEHEQAGFLLQYKHTQNFAARRQRLFRVRRALPAILGRCRRYLGVAGDTRRRRYSGVAGDTLALPAILGCCHRYTGTQAAINRTGAAGGTRGPLWPPRLPQSPPIMTVRVGSRILGLIQRTDSVANDMISRQVLPIRHTSRHKQN